MRNTHAALHRALRDAVRWGYVVRNVADLIDAPKPKPTDMKFWTPAQLRAFLKTVRADGLSALWVLFATTGMRRGEVAGLRWVDVDFEAPRLLVRTPRVTFDREIVVSEPKTARTASGNSSGGRTWSRGSSSPCPTALRSRRTTSRTGSSRGPRRRACPESGFTTLRHSYASAALAAGVPAKVVSERLGHANIGITMDTYSHVMPQLDQEAANKVADLIFGNDEEGPSDGS